MDSPLAGNELAYWQFFVSCGEYQVMGRSRWVVAVIAVPLLVPSLTLARGYGRSSGRNSGMVYTQFGPMNTRSPEYQMSGGNPAVYQQLVQQRMMMQQQQMLMQQQMKSEQMQSKSKNQNNPSNREMTSDNPYNRLRRPIISKKAKKKKLSKATADTEGTTKVSKPSDASSTSSEKDPGAVFQNKSAKTKGSTSSQP